MSFTMNWKDFDSRFKAIVEKTIPGLAEKGLFKAGAELIKYAIKEEPRCPHKTGRLWGAQKIIATSTLSKIEVEVGFNTNYAAAVHEMLQGNEQWGMVVQWTLKGSGPKYLSSKLPRHKDDLMKKAADEISGGAK